jgi:transcription antitermination factor NusG
VLRVSQWWWLRSRPTPVVVASGGVTRVEVDDPSQRPFFKAWLGAMFMPWKALTLSVNPPGPGAAVVTVDGPLPGSVETDENPSPPPSPYDRPGRWYLVSTHAGHENKVRSNLQSLTSPMNLADGIYEVVVPMEVVAEFKGGEEFTERKAFPGYVLCRCKPDDDSWSSILQTPGVTGFVGPGSEPTPLSRAEVESILHHHGEAEEQRRSKPRLVHEVGSAAVSGTAASDVGTTAPASEGGRRRLLASAVFSLLGFALLGVAVSHHVVALDVVAVVWIMLGLLLGIRLMISRPRR